MFCSGASSLLVSFSFLVGLTVAATGPSDPKSRASAVREAYRYGMQGYFAHAFPNDELRPLTNTPYNSRNGWGSTAIDSLSTGIIMQEAQIVSMILADVPGIDFSQAKNDSSVSLFETTIRYIGGLLSAHDMLTGPYKNLTNDDVGVDSLLSQAKKLADNMKFSFDTPSGIPIGHFFLSNHTADMGATNNGTSTLTADAGTLIMEWTRLSDKTGDPIYHNLTQRAEEYMLNPTAAPGIASAMPFPGMVGTTINITTGKYEDAFGGWISGSDSFYEYLIKMYVYDPVRFLSYKERWVMSADASMKNLASHPTTKPNITYMAAYNNTDIIFYSEHLACFHGGNFILGGIVLKEQKYIDFGVQLTDGCENLYSQTTTGIGPGSFNWDAETPNTATKNATNNVPFSNTTFYQKSGFWINGDLPGNGYVDGGQGYGLNPEVVESFYYAYLVTGDQKYRDYSWNAFVAVNKTCRQGSGFSVINDVMNPTGGKSGNFQPSFWFAETLKYMFLIQDADEHGFPYGKPGNLSFDWILNTEGHPMRVNSTQVAAGGDNGGGMGVSGDTPVPGGDVR